MMDPYVEYNAPIPSAPTPASSQAMYAVERHRILALDQILHQQLLVIACLRSCRLLPRELLHTCHVAV